MPRLGLLFKQAEWLSSKARLQQHQGRSTSEHLVDPSGESIISSLNQKQRFWNNCEFNSPQLAVLPKQIVYCCSCTPLHCFNCLKMHE